MLTPNSLAAANAVSVKNESFAPQANVLERKILVIGTYDTTKTVVENTPVRVFSPEEVGDSYGFGYMLHRLTQKAFAGAKGVPVYVIAQDESVGAVVSDGTITFTAVGLKAGTVYLYIAGELVTNFTVADGDTSDAVATKCAAAITALKEQPATAVVNGVTANQVDFESKTKGVWGNGITLKFNLKPGEAFPTGLSAVVVAMASGTGIPDIDDALDGTGTGDNQNELHFTDLVDGYGDDATTLSKKSVYNGLGDQKIGNYSEIVARPFRSLYGNTVADTAGLTALIVTTDLVLTDRTNGPIAAPGSPAHPAELAALAIGVIARINNIRAEENAINVALDGIIAGADADRWTNSYDNRDLAVKSGISPTLVKSGVVTLQNVVSHYRPASIPVESNGYRSMRNISIIQNMLNATKVNFSTTKWQGISIVDDISLVSNVSSREKARDIDSVIDDLVELARQFEGRAWIYQAAFTINKLKEAGAVVIRSGTNGFDNSLKVILSGEGGILNTEVVFDTSIAVLLS